MIAKLKGVVDSRGDDWVVIDVGGVGYLVFCSGKTLGALHPGEAASVVIETHVREDHIHLYGFSGEGERDWFRLLTSVQGVGAKVALGILSVLGPDQLLSAIASQDKNAIRQGQGVGPKLAGRIVSELKDKVGGLALGAAAMPAGPSVSPAFAGGAVSDATSALVNLGYSPSDALTAVTAVQNKLGEDARVEDLIRGGLAELGPKDLR